MPDFPEISLWLQGLEQAVRPPLPGDRDYDVAIVGGGYTGLWTAYYLKQLAPRTRICLLESQICGFGASGRNGGWMMGAIEGAGSLLRDLDGDGRARALHAVHGIVEEVAGVLARHDLDCDFSHGGGIYAAARYPEQEAVQRAWLQQQYELGHLEQDYRWLDAGELSARLNIRSPRGAIYTPHIARIHPGKLVRGLADLVVGLGVDVYENTAVTAVDGDQLYTPTGTVTAPVRVIAIEGFSQHLQQHRRIVLPVQSRIIATRPLTTGQWETIGLRENEVFSEASPLVTYGQRTADGRLVFGSRGAYRFGGAPRSDFVDDGRAFRGIHRLLLDCFPQLADVEIEACWGGTLGVSRSGSPHAIYDRDSGYATAGGYLGEGVGASNLMARTLVDLILERESELAAMPWARVDMVPGQLAQWEPEPLRWLGFQLVSAAQVAAERCFTASPNTAYRPLLSRLGTQLVALADIFD